MCINDDIKSYSNARNGGGVGLKTVICHVFYEFTSFVRFSLIDISRDTKRQVEFFEHVDIILDFFVF